MFELFAIKVMATECSCCEGVVGLKKGNGARLEKLLFVSFWSIVMDAPSQPWSINVARQHDLHLHIYNRMPRPILVGKNKIKIYKVRERRNIMSISDTSNTHMPGRKACWIISRPSSTVTSDSTTNAAEVVRVGGLWKEETYIHVTHKHKLALDRIRKACVRCAQQSHVQTTRCSRINPKRLPLWSWKQAPLASHTMVLKCRPCCPSFFSSSWSIYLEIPL